jgi:hypothetical protein
MGMEKTLPCHFALLVAILLCNTPKADRVVQNVKERIGKVLQKATFQEIPDGTYRNV